jgi:hypothetical protein
VKEQQGEKGSQGVRKEEFEREVKDGQREREGGRLQVREKEEDREDEEGESESGRGYNVLGSILFPHCVVCVHGFVVLLYRGQIPVGTQCSANGVRCV